MGTIANSVLSDPSRFRHDTNLAIMKLFAKISSRNFKVYIDRMIM